jgi:hypothetical protein
VLGGPHFQKFRAARLPLQTPKCSPPRPARHHFLLGSPVHIRLLVPRPSLGCRRIRALGDRSPLQFSNFLPTILLLR